MAGLFPGPGAGPPIFGAPPTPTTSTSPGGFPGLIPGLPSAIPGLPTALPGPFDPFDPDPSPTLPTIPNPLDPSLTTTSTPTTTSATIPTVVAPLPTTTSTPLTPPPVVTVTNTITPTQATPTVRPSQVPVQEAARSPSFFQNKPLMTGVFTVLGLALAALIVGCAVFAIRRRRASRIDREIAEAGRMPFMRDEVDEAIHYKAQAPARGYSLSDHGHQDMSQQYAPSGYGASTYPSTVASVPYAAQTSMGNAPRYPNAGPYGPSGNGGYDPYGQSAPPMRTADPNAAYAGMMAPPAGASYRGAAGSGEYYPSYPPSSEDYHPISPGRARTESSGATTLASSSNGLPANTRIAQAQQRGDVPLPLVPGVRRYSQAQQQQQQYGQSPPLSPLDRELPKPPPRRQDSVGSLREMDYGATRADLKVVNG